MTSLDIERITTGDETCQPDVCHRLTAGAPDDSQVALGDIAQHVPVFKAGLDKVVEILSHVQLLQDGGERCHVDRRPVKQGPRRCGWGVGTIRMGFGTVKRSRLTAGPTSGDGHGRFLLFLRMLLSEGTSRTLPHAPLRSARAGSSRRLFQRPLDLRWDGGRPAKRWRTWPQGPLQSHQGLPTEIQIGIEIEIAAEQEA